MDLLRASRGSVPERPDDRGSQAGIGLLERRDPVQAEVYEAWLATVLRDYADRIIPVDAETAEEWGSMNAPGPVPVVDGLMAATAKVRNMTFVTRNTSDVARTGARLLNPFDSPV